MNYRVSSTVAADNTKGGLTGLTKLLIDEKSPFEKRKFQSARRMMGYMTEREKSLLNCLNATWEIISKPYFQNGYCQTSKTEETEKKIVDMQARVLDGKASLSDFRKVVEQWGKEVLLAKSIALQGTIRFVSESKGLN